MQIEGVIGMTVDEKDVVLVHINEAFHTMKVSLKFISHVSVIR